MAEKQVSVQIKTNEEIMFRLYMVWFIIILVFVGGAIGVGEWLAGFVHYYSFVSGSKSAQATAAFENQKPGEVYNYLGEQRYYFPLQFKTESGHWVISNSDYPTTYVPQRALDALARDGYVTVLYLPGHRPRILLFGEDDIQKLSKYHYGSLAWGLVFMTVGVVLVRNRYKLLKTGTTFI
jgi:hypothetical protein